MPKNTSTTSGTSIVVGIALVAIVVSAAMYYNKNKPSTESDNRPKQNITFSVTFDPEFINNPTVISITVDNEPFHTATNKSGSWSRTFKLPDGSTVIMTATQPNTSVLECLIIDDNGNELDSNDISQSPGFAETGKLECKTVV